MASMGVFTAGGTPIDEQVPLQPVGVSCRRGSSWSDVVYYRWKKEGDRGDKAACRAGCASILGLLRPREKGSCSFFEVLGTIGSGSQWLNKTKREQNIIHPALLWGRSGAVTISRRAGSIDSGSPVSGTPLALALYGLGRGGDGLRRFPESSSMLRPLWKLLLLPSWSRGGGRRTATLATSRRRVCSRWQGGDSSRPPVQDVSKRLSLLLHGRELLEEILHHFAKWAGLGDRGVQGAMFVSLPHICQGQPQVALLDYQCGHRVSQGPLRDFRRS